MAELVGKRVLIFFTDDAARIFKYEGKILSINDSIVVLEDIKEGTVILPIEKCRMREIG